MAIAVSLRTQSLSPRSHSRRRSRLPRGTASGCGVVSAKRSFPGQRFLITLAITVLVWLAWSIVNWFLSLAAIFVIARGEDTFGSIIAAVDLCQTCPGSIFAAGTWFGFGTHHSIRRCQFGDWLSIGIRGGPSCGRSPGRHSDGNGCISCHCRFLVYRTVGSVCGDCGVARIEFTLPDPGRHPKTSDVRQSALLGVKRESIRRN